MSAGWNFERRRDTCTRFILGTAAIVQRLPDKETNLEAVRNRVGLTPEEALFAARQLASKNLLAFDPGGSVRSSARGLEHAETLAAALRKTIERYDDVVLALATGGAPVQVLAALIHFDGGSTPCGASDSGAAYRLAFAKKNVVLERLQEDGSFCVTTP